MTRKIVRLLAITLLSLGLAVQVTSPASAHPRWPDQIELPDGFRPEGIAIGHGKTAYLGSLADGDIYAANLRTGKGSVISQGPGTPSVGLKVDHRGRLFIAGGPSGTGRVLNLRTGHVTSYQFASAPTFVNDVVLTRKKAWFTDSQKPQLYALPLGRHGRLPSQSNVVTLQLSGDWDRTPGAAFANGITQTPNRRALLVIQSNTGLLMRVNPRTGVATQVDLGGVALTQGDGMLLRGRTLYVVQNRANQVAIVKLNRAGTAGVVRSKVLTDPGFDVPTTIAAAGHSLYLPNARFDTTPTPTTEYWITRIHKPRHR
jgi:sugar lactone lactonase YvrE